MSGFFNYDNTVWRFIGKFWDVLVLNFLWLICSLPLFTIGASTTAVYYVTLKLARDEDGYTVRSFFRSFKQNFKQATAIWLILSVIGAILGFDLFYFIKLFPGDERLRTVLLVITMGFTIIYTAIMTFVFPLQSRFYNPVKKTLFNAFFMSIRHLFHTIAIIAIDALVFYIMFIFVWPMVFFGFPLIAFLNSFLFNVIFRKYMPKEQTDSDQFAAEE